MKTENEIGVQTGAEQHECTWKDTGMERHEKHLGCQKQQVCEQSGDTRWVCAD
jgi:hypothetical protein